MKPYSLIQLLAVLLMVSSEVYSHRILVLYPFTSKSHKNFAIPIMEALVEKGHEVTLINPYKTSIKNPRFRDILVKTTFEDFEKNGLMPIDDIFEPKQTKGLKSIPLFWSDKFAAIAKIVFEEPEVMKAANEEWDLVVINAFMNEFTYGLAAKINKPIVMFSAGMLLPWLDSTTRNPRHYPHLISSFIPVAPDHSLIQRTFEFILAHAMDYMYETYYLPELRDGSVPYFGNDIPEYSDISKNISLILTNSHYTVHGARPHLPHVVEVGGLHCKPAEKLPKNLEDFAESSGAEGFIFFSLGSIAQGSKMPERCRKEFVKAFSMIPYKVIWKWETEQMEGLPSNVLLVKWAPQQDILGHPKLRLFITHGGGLSTQEALYHGVPRIGFPLAGDQPMNMRVTEKTGTGISLSILNVTAEQLVHSINEIIKNQSYSRNTKRISSLFRDQYPPPLERAVYWIEYVIRHNGAKELKSVVANVPWVQFHYVDVYALLTAVALTLLAVVFLALKTFCWGLRKCFGKNKQKSKKE